MSNAQRNRVFNTTTGFANTQQGNSQNSYDTANSLYSAEGANPGYSATEKQQMKQGAIGGVAGAANAAANQLEQRAARTGNTAGANSAAEQIALQGGQKESEALGGLEEAFGNKRIAGMQNAAAGEGGLSSEQGGLAQRNLGTAEQMAAQPTFWQKMALSAMQNGAGLIKAVKDL